MPELPGPRAMVLLGLIALVIRFLYFGEHSGSPFFAVPLLDQKYYDLFAQAIAFGGDLQQFGGFRPMLYPLFLAMLYKIGGAQLGIALAILVQHLFGVVITLSTTRIAGKLFRDWRSGMAAGLLYALASPPLYFEGELLIEPFLTFLVVILFELIIRAEESESPSAFAWWAAAGAWTALAAQARPNALLFFGAFAVMIVWAIWKKQQTRWIGSLIATGAGIIVILLFGFVNSAQSGYWQPLTSAGGINFYVGNNSEADGMIPRQAHSVVYEGEYRDSIQEFARQEYRQAMFAQGLTPSDRGNDVSDYWMAQAREEIADDPGRWLGLMAKKTWLIFWNHEIANNKSFSFILQHESTLLSIMPVRWWVLMGLFPVGIWAAWKRGQHRIQYWLLAFFAIYAFSIVLFFVNSRFRIPLWPVAAIFGGGALIAIYEFAQAKIWNRTIQMVALFSLGASFSSSNLWGVITPDFSRDYFFRSIANAELGRFPEAREDAITSLGLDPTNLDAQLHLGNVAYRIEDYETALRAYRRVTEMAPNEPRAWNNYGAVLEALGRHGDALRAYDRAIDLSGAHVNSLINAAMLEIRAGLIDAAAPRLRAAAAILEGQPPRADLLAARAFLEELRGNPTDRDYFFQEAVSADQAVVERMAAEFQNKIAPEELTGN